MREVRLEAKLYRDIDHQDRWIAWSEGSARGLSVTSADNAAWLNWRPRHVVIVPSRWRLKMAWMVKLQVYEHQLVVNAGFDQVLRGLAGLRKHESLHRRELDRLSQVC
jgi:hypothetical protein